jgi:hemerythrin-like domain-containing protein
METISGTLSSDHRRCDELFARAEEHIANRQWDAGAPAFGEFMGAMEQHFSMEEQVLFPSFEERTGQQFGPTQVMRMEHAQMRQLLREMAASVAERDRDAYLGQSETLLMLMQQHNAKEEQVLYRMADQVLATSVPEVLARMRTTSAGRQD